MVTIKRPACDHRPLRPPYQSLNAIHLQQGRGQCQARSLCERGCPFGGYFSSNASTLPWAMKTGNLTFRPDSVVHSIIYDEKKGKATGVRVIDAHTKEATEYYAKIIFVNAATMNSNLIMLNSTSSRFPNGLGNDSGVLGKYIAFQNYRGNVAATIDGYLDYYYYGRRPCAIMMPNFRNVRKQEMDFQRGYMIFYSVMREGWGHETEGSQIGANFKENIAEAGALGDLYADAGRNHPKGNQSCEPEQGRKGRLGDTAAENVGRL